MTTRLHLRPIDCAEFSGDAVADERVRLDYDRFNTAVRATAGMLAEHGVDRGDVVAVVPALTEDEVSCQLSDGNARVAIVDATSRALVKNVPVIDVDAVLAATSDAALTRPFANGPQADDLALLHKKDLIIRGGENISPSEVEAVLASHPSVLEVAVVGKPDPVMGEEPIAFVVAASGHVINADELLDTVRTVLARFKVPKEIRVVDSLPRNVVGKVLKAQLRESLTEPQSTSA